MSDGPESYVPNPALAWIYHRFFEHIEVDQAWAGRVREADARGTVLRLDRAHGRAIAARAPRPRIAEPERRKQIELRDIRATIGRGDANQNVGRRRLRILDLDVEVAVLVERAGVEQLELRIILSAPAILVETAGARVINAVRRLRAASSEKRRRSARSRADTRRAPNRNPFPGREDARGGSDISYTARRLCRMRTSGTYVTMQFSTGPEGGS